MISNARGVELRSHVCTYSNLAERASPWPRLKKKKKKRKRTGLENKRLNGNLEVTAIEL